MSLGVVQQIIGTTWYFPVTPFVQWKVDWCWGTEEVREGVPSAPHMHQTLISFLQEKLKKRGDIVLSEAGFDFPKLTCVHNPNCVWVNSAMHEESVKVMFCGTSLKHLQISHVHKCGWQTLDAPCKRKSNHQHFQIHSALHIFLANLKKKIKNVKTKTPLCLRPERQRGDGT